MDNQRLQDLISEEATIVDGQLGFWEIRYQDRDMSIIADETHDRMRIMTSVLRELQMTDADRREVLSANFDRALDAKFALARGHLWALFVHPLKALTDDLFRDAIRQVKQLADNYGSSYASTHITFGNSPIPGGPDADVAAS